MVKKYEIEVKSISHVSEIYDNYNITYIKYLINLYRKYGEDIFLDRTTEKYQRDKKLLGI